MSRRAPLRRRWLAAAATALLALAPAAAAAQPWSSITFFGDSFSDMGMADVLSAIVGNVDPTPEPPYWPGPPPLFFPGTASNGPTWTSYFASALGRPSDALTAVAPPGVPSGNNFAISGARTGLLGTGGNPIGLQSQLALFAGIVPPGVPLALAPRAVDPTGLYVLWAGVNDLRDLADAAPVNPLPSIQSAVANVAGAAAQLATNGARSFLIPRAPNSSVVPEVALSPATAARRLAYTTTFNVLLDAALAQLAAQFPTARFTTFDLDPLYGAIIADAATGGARYGITNVSAPCFPGFGVPASDCDVSLFSDALHPTTRAHALVANVALAAVVPEPATVALVGGGLALLALGARRRRSAARRV